jgi:hypothetical protein
MRTVTLASLAALAFAAATAISASADEHRELGPHVHGHGTLDIAVEKNRVSMELVAPGMDIVGFEHAASNGEQEDAVAKAKGILSDPATLFRMPSAAGCKVQTADVEIEPEHHEHGDDDDHDRDATADGDGHGAHDTHGGHNQFHMTYALDCAKPAAISSIVFDYFKSFAGARSLTVNIVTDKAQTSYEVSREKPQLDLPGVM